MLVAFLIISTPAWAENSYKIKDLISEGPTLTVIAEYNINGVLLMQRVPIFGIYTKQYIHESLENRLNTLLSVSPEHFQRLLDDSSSILPDADDRKAKKVKADDAITVMASDKNKNFVIP